MISKLCEFSDGISDGHKTGLPSSLCTNNQRILQHFACRIQIWQRKLVKPACLLDFAMFFFVLLCSAIFCFVLLVVCSFLLMFAPFCYFSAALLSCTISHCAIGFAPCCSCLLVLLFSPGGSVLHYVAMYCLCLLFVAPRGHLTLTSNHFGG